MKKAFPLLLCLSFFFATSLAQEVKKPEWVEVVSNESYKIFYSPKRVTHSPHSIVRAWTKVIPTNETGRQHIIENRNSISERERSRVDYSNYAYTLTLYEFDCEQRRWRVHSSSDYDGEGGKIEGGIGMADFWQYVSPDTNTEKIMETICSH